MDLRCRVGWHKWWRQYEHTRTCMRCDKSQWRQHIQLPSDIGFTDWYVWVDINDDLFDR